MRCMACGEEKVLAEAMPAQDMAVPGFEYQTLECPGCNDTERRLLFTGRVTVFARRQTETAASPSHPRQLLEQKVEAPTSSNAPIPETICNGSSVEGSIGMREEGTAPGEGVTEFPGEVTEPANLEADPPLIPQEPGASAGSNVSAQAWLRAVEKLRRHEADLLLRAEEAKKANCNIEFDIAWDSLAVPRKRQPLSVAQPRNIIQSRREQLPARPLSMAGICRSQLPQPAQEGDNEAIRRFDERWNSIGSSQHPRETESSELPPPLGALPVPLSLVAAEGINAARTPIRRKYVLNIFKKLLEVVGAAVPSRE
jgi:hypothetical protein